MSSAEHLEATLNLQDLEQVRQLLYGGSALDWQQLAYETREQVDRFLPLLGLQPNDPYDEPRLWHIHQRALDYLRQNFTELRLCPEVHSPQDVRDLFLLASRPGPQRRDACAMLKVMHVVHHSAGRDLHVRMSVPSHELFRRIEMRVFEAVEKTRREGVRIREFASSQKSSHSVLTKLLCRSDSLAAEVYDRLRFRVVPETIYDLFLALAVFARELVPFNYIVPGQSRNDLVDYFSTLQANPRLATLTDRMQRVQTDIKGLMRVNHFSGRDFRMVNFVVDLPVSVADLVQASGFDPVRNGQVVFVLVEFQLMDRKTEIANNAGENHHRFYKQRQHDQVYARLFSQAPTEAGAHCPAED